MAATATLTDQQAAPQAEFEQQELWATVRKTFDTKRGGNVAHLWSPSLTIGALGYLAHRWPRSLGRQRTVAFVLGNMGDMGHCKLSAPVIARRLNCSTKTIQNHLSAAYKDRVLAYVGNGKARVIFPGKWLVNKVTASQDDPEQEMGEPSTYPGQGYVEGPTYPGQGYTDRDLEKELVGAPPVEAAPAGTPGDVKEDGVAASGDQPNGTATAAPASTDRSTVGRSGVVPAATPRAGKQRRRRSRYASGVRCPRKGHPDCLGETNTNPRDGKPNRYCNPCWTTRDDWMLNDWPDCDPENVVADDGPTCDSCGVGRGHAQWCPVDGGVGLVDG